jgi:hypothetical protein
MSDEEKFKRLTITLPPDLLDWVKQKKRELEIADRRVSTSVSAIIADAVAEMRTLDQSGKLQTQPSPKQGKAASPERAGAKTLKLSANLDTGSSKAGTDRSRKTG